MITVKQMKKVVKEVVMVKHKRFTNWYMKEFETEIGITGPSLFHFES